MNDMTTLTLTLALILALSACWYLTRPVFVTRMALPPRHVFSMWLVGGTVEGENATAVPGRAQMGSDGETIWIQWTAMPVTDDMDAWITIVPAGRMEQRRRRVEHFQLYARGEQ